MMERVPRTILYKYKGYLIMGEEFPGGFVFYIGRNMREVIDGFGVAFTSLMDAKRWIDEAS